MKRFKVKIPLEYLEGILTKGHIEYLYDAETEEEAIQKAKDGSKPITNWVNVVADEYEIDDYGDFDLERVSAEEL